MCECECEWLSDKGGDSGRPGVEFALAGVLELEPAIELPVP